MLKKFFCCFVSMMIILPLTNVLVSAEDPVSVTGTQKVYIIGEDWGPAVSKTIIHLDTPIRASSLDVNQFLVTEIKEGFDWGTLTAIEARNERTILDVYLSDENGNKNEADAGSFLTIEMDVSPSEGSPFLYNLTTGRNNWCAYYRLEILVAANSIQTEDGKPVSAFSIEKEIDLTDQEQRISEIADDFNLYQFESSEGITFSYGEYVPTLNYGEPRPLVIWLHGAGEGGSDNYIDLLGNEVTALANEEFQTILEGAYILTPQAPTMWMDDGTGNYQSGDIGSCYRKGLMELITTYVDENPNIDPNRIIIGGCSNGGYMTLEMILNYPEYFAAAYPICEAFSDEFISDEQIKALIDNEVGIWFIHALNDTTVNPATTTLPTYQRLVDQGATNVHVSLFDNVVDTTGRFKNEDGTAHQYNGHWSWVYFFNNKCVNTDNNETLWQWLSQQKKSVKQPVEAIITISPETADVKQGETLQFEVTVENLEEENANVRFEISGNSTGETTISTSGLLTIGNNETVGAEIKVTVISEFDSNVFAVATIKVVEKDKDTTGSDVTPNNPDQGSGSIGSPNTKDDHQMGYSVTIMLAMMMVAGCVVYNKRRYE